jgi:hypothetical protein
VIQIPIYELTVLFYHLLDESVNTYLPFGPLANFQQNPTKKATTWVTSF